MTKVSMAAGIVAVLLALSGPAIGQQGALQTSMVGPSHSDSTQMSYARHLAGLINDYRKQHGLGPLVLVEDLSAIATEHTAQMAEQRRLSHDGFRSRFASTRARICVENVGWNFPFPEAQLEGWRASPGHHRNLLEPKVARMGVAASRSYVTFFACS
jgi:uncharacterized protein YkwD